METGKLRTFLDLADTLSFSETAENLYTTQSSISKQIKSLEKELDTPLFIRDNRHVKLSETGKAILDNVNGMLVQEEKLWLTLERYRQHNKSLIKMAVIPTFSSSPLFKKITEYMDQHPQINFKLLEVESNKILAMLEDQKVDLVFYRCLEKNENHEQFTSLLTRKAQFKLCVADDDPLIQKEKVNLEEVSNRPFIMLDKSSQLYQPVLDLCTKANFNPNIILTSERITSIVEMVKHHQGISILMDPGEKFPGVKFIPITPTLTSSLYFIRQKDNKKTQLVDFWRYLEKLINSKSE